jgi:hypothetical protein
VQRQAAGDLGGRNQQELVDARKSGDERLGAFVVGLAHDDATPGKILRLCPIPDGSHNAVSRNVLQQRVDHKPPKLPCRAGYCVHSPSSFVVSRRGT